MKILFVISCLFFCTELCLTPAVRPQVSSVMSYNIRYDTSRDEDNQWTLRKDELADLLNYYSPDILGIQEGLNHQVEFIDDQLSNHSYIGVGRDDGDTQGEYAAIFYDSTVYSLTKDISFWLSDTPHKVSVGWDASMERICTYGKFIHKEKKTDLHVFNAHFDHRGEISRLNAAKLILSQLDSLASPLDAVIVMGDLNAIPESEPIKQLTDKLDDCAYVASQPMYGPIGTFSGFLLDPELNRRIDYIFSKNLDILDFRHIDDKRKNNLWVSDHLPVMTTISFK